MGKFVFGFRTGLLDQTLTEENKRFYKGMKGVLSNSIFLSRSKWMKYIFPKKYKELKEGMRDWYNIGVKHINKVAELVKAADKSGKELDEHIGILKSLL